jgi:serine/threonine protein kinase
MKLHPGTYICESVIGTGGFATVYRARHRTAPVRVAIKLVCDRQLTSEMDRTRLMREVSLLKQMDHPFIAKLFFVTRQETNVAIVQEYVPHGTLLDFLTQHGPLPEPQLKYYFIQILSVVDYLHNVRKVTHRDLKLENILLDAFNNIRVVDFGLGRAFLDPADTFTTPCGSPPYLAPEMVTAGVYTRETDIWSLGVVLYTLATGTMPFYGPDFSELCQQIVERPILYPTNLSDDLIDLLKRMLCRNHATRITIEEMKSHPWFPAEPYASIFGSPAISPFFEDRGASQFPDPDVVRIMESNGLCCAGLEEAMQAGEETEMTILHSIYLRSLQSERINRTLRASTLKLASVREQRSLPVMWVGRTAAPAIGHASQDWRKSRSPPREVRPLPLRRRRPMRPLVCPAAIPAPA